jgi:hypothetical protein
LALRAFSNQTIASSVRDCSRCTLPDPAIPNVELGIARAKADGLLHERDRLLYRPGEELALAERV